MEISGVLAAAKFVSTALGYLVKRNEPPEAARAKPLETPATLQAPQPTVNTAALREIVARYDVTDISPRQFSAMIQKLHEAGALTDQDFQELSLIRVDLDLETVAPDEPLDLLDFYLDKLRELHRDLEDLRDSAGSEPASLPALTASIQRRLEWLEKFALIQSAPEAIRLDTLV